MDFKLHLEYLRQRQLITKDLIAAVLHVRQRLELHWHADVHTSQMEMALVHLAMALGRIQRDCTAYPLAQDILDEIKSAVDFPRVLQIHQDLLNLLPFPIPESEQTHLLANWYSMILDQPWILAEKE